MQSSPIISRHIHLQRAQAEAVGFFSRSPQAAMIAYNGCWVLAGLGRQGLAGSRPSAFQRIFEIPDAARADVWCGEDVAATVSRLFGERKTKKLSVARSTPSCSIEVRHVQCHGHGLDVLKEAGLASAFKGAAVLCGATRCWRRP